ncbi:ester cyclase [Luteimonas salinilitoris]|uniref:Ester cyclase n=1 Tax=Luteimonas salinilitoris TaxID=3237697 RepID=A0ABV4HRC3_9GAMM
MDWLKLDKLIFPDGKITDHQIIVSGNTAAIRWTMEGTHKGPLPTPAGDIPASGKKVRIEGTEFFTFNSQGKLIRLDALTNDMGLMGQIKAK